MMDDQQPPCPLCTGASSFFFTAHGYPVYQCDKCWHQFARPENEREHVRQVYGDDYFSGGKDGYGDYHAEQDLLRSSGRFYGELLSRFTSPGSLLDIGAAAGYLLEGFATAGWQGAGVEPNTAMARNGRARGLNLINTSFENFPVDRSYDAIAMIQVISHCIDPCQVLQRCHQLLTPAGLLLVETWDRSSWTARIAGQRWHEYSPPSVLHWFSRQSLDALLLTSGFTKQASGRPAKKIKADHALSLLRYKAGAMPLGRLLIAPLALLPRHLCLPYFLDDIFWSVYQKREQPVPLS